MKKLKIKYNSSELQTIEGALFDAIAILNRELEELISPADAERDMQYLLIAALDECYRKIKKAQIDFRPRYTIDFTPVQAFAIRSYFAGVWTSSNDYQNNIFHQLCNEADSTFA